MSAPTSALGFPFALYQRGPVSMLLERSQWYLTVPYYSVFSNLGGEVKGGFCSSDSVSVSAGTMPLGLGTLPFQGSYPSHSCSSSYIMYSFPSPWSRVFLQPSPAAMYFHQSSKSNSPSHLFGPQEMSQLFFSTPLPLLAVSFLASVLQAFNMLRSFTA